MDLRVKITGLCLIVPQTVASRTVYHVVMPVTGHFGGSHVHEHRATLSYDGSITVRGLACRFLDLSGITGTSGTADLSALVDVGKLVNKKVNPSLLRPGAGEQAAGLVTLPAPTQTVFGDQVEWEEADDQCVLQGKPPHMLTHHLQWLVQGIGSTFPQMRLQRLRPSCPSVPPEDDPLPVPTPHGDEVCLSIVNLPVTPMPTISAGACAAHFPAYFRVFNLFSGVPNLQLKTAPPSPPPPPADFQCPGAPSQMALEAAESAFNCMLARSDPG